MAAFYNDLKSMIDDYKLLDKLDEKAENEANSKYKAYGSGDAEFSDVDVSALVEYQILKSNQHYIDSAVERGIIKDFDIAVNSYYQALVEQKLFKMLDETYKGRINKLLDNDEWLLTFIREEMYNTEVGNNYIAHHEEIVPTILDKMINTDFINKVEPSAIYKMYTYFLIENAPYIFIQESNKIKYKQLFDNPIIIDKLKDFLLENIKCYERIRYWDVVLGPNMQKFIETRETANKMMQKICWEEEKEPGELP